MKTKKLHIKKKLEEKIACMNSIFNDVNVLNAFRSSSQAEVDYCHHVLVCYHYVIVVDLSHTDLTLLLILHCARYDCDIAWSSVAVL